MWLRSCTVSQQLVSNYLMPQMLFTNSVLYAGLRIGTLSSKFCLCTFRVSTTPYYFSKNNPDCSTPGPDGLGYSANSSGSCPLPAIKQTNREEQRKVTHYFRDLRSVIINIKFCFVLSSILFTPSFRQMYQLYPILFLNFILY